VAGLVQAINEEKVDLVGQQVELTRELQMLRGHIEQHTRLLSEWIEASIGAPPKTAAQDVARTQSGAHDAVVEDVLNQLQKSRGQAGKPRGGHVSS
jgi:hypothetical protein